MTGDLLVESSGGLSIVAATPALLDAEDRAAGDLAGLLGADLPLAWPPQFNSPQTRAWMRRLLAEHPGEPGYGSWYIIGEGRLAGVCGYKGPPKAVGEVEIGYSVVEPDQRKGLATGAVRLLIARAFRDPRVKAVAAETLPSLIASQKVLERCGFRMIDRRPHPEHGEIWRYLRSPLGG